MNFLYNIVNPRYLKSFSKIFECLMQYSHKYSALANIVFNTKKLHILVKYIFICYYLRFHFRLSLASSSFAIAEHAFKLTLVILQFWQWQTKTSANNKCTQRLQLTENILPLSIDIKVLLKITKKAGVCIQSRGYVK